MSKSQPQHDKIKAGIDAAERGDFATDDEVVGVRRKFDRRVGLTTELPEEWAVAVRTAKVPEESAHLDIELK